MTQGVQPTWQTADGSVRLYLGDCLEVLPGLEAGSVDAVVTDPPYGIRADEAAAKNNGKWGWKHYGESHWDRDRPSKEVFDSILSVSETAVIWGGNYFADLLPASMGWLGWDKGQRDFSLADFSLADFELAWTSERRAARFVQYARGKAILDGRFHPTQKPIEVMRWCLDWLRLSGDSPTICDPFMGSGTTGVACVRTGRKFIGIEKEERYFDISVRRIEAELNRAPLFDEPAVVQKELL